MSVKIEFKFPEWEKEFKARRPEIDRFIAAQLQTNRGMIFDKEGAHNGRKKWAPLKLRRGQILKQRGTLSKSIAPPGHDGNAGPDGIVRIKGDTITVGTNLFYARLMNDGTVSMPGGVLKAKNAKALKIPLPQGKKATEGAQELQKQNAVKKASLQIAKYQHQLSKAKSYKSKTRLADQIARAQERLQAGKGGDKFIFRKSVKILARPFDDWNEADAKELGEALAQKLAEILGLAKVRKPR